MKEQKPKQYTQVFIKSEADLPKPIKDKDNWFVEIAVIKKSGKKDWWIYNPDWDKKLWMEQIDWYLKEVEPLSDERFKKPTDKQLIDIGIFFNDGNLEIKKLSDMVAMTEFILDRLYENNDVTIPSSKEKAIRDGKIPKANKESEEDGMNQFD